MLVHLGASEILKSYSMIPVAFPGDLVTSVTREDLPSNWRAFPSPAALQTIGDEWVARSDSLVLKVPSVAIDEEHNYLINTEHSDFPRISVGAPEPFEFDRRLMK
jgi:RES domain-containing protein